jgi:hypothetical protein
MSQDAFRGVLQMLEDAVVGDNPSFAKTGKAYHTQRSKIVRVV